jgi:hypothetical protein
MRGDPEALCTHYLRTLFVGMRGEAGPHPPGGGGGGPRLVELGADAGLGHRRVVVLHCRVAIACAPGPLYRYYVSTIDRLCIYYR